MKWKSLFFGSFYVIQDWLIRILGQQVKKKIYLIIKKKTREIKIKNIYKLYKTNHK